MDRFELFNYAANLVNNGEGNFVNAEQAISEELIGMRIFETPLMACAKADDGYFFKLKEEGVIGAHFMAPKEWLNSAQSVISFFFPFTEQIKVSNRADMSKPSNEWLHGRIEGQRFIVQFCKGIKAYLENNGCKVVVPSLDERFKSGNPLIKDKSEQGFYSSNWSERHVAFVCGLGTFGLSKGLITEKGVAGRLASFIIDNELDGYSERKYTDIYENCNMCGACVINCPAKAISKEKGKIHPICSAFLDGTKLIYNPRYGCGKCQVKVPCESKIPVKKA